MKPIKFKYQTKELQRPGDMTDEQCGPLPALIVDNCVISCWKLSWRERLKILLTGVAWLSIRSGNTQPPASISTELPCSESDAQLAKQMADRRSAVISRLVNVYGVEASAKAQRLDDARIKPGDLRRTFGVAREVFEEARLCGVRTLCGLKLYCSE